MIKKIILTGFLFFTFQFLFSIEVETRFYNSDQTKEEVKSVYKDFEKEYEKKKFEVNYIQKVSEDDYTIQYILTSNGAKAISTVRYQFFADRVTVSILSCEFLSKEGVKNILLPDDANEKKKAVYNSLKHNYVDSIFEYLNISKNILESPTKLMGK